MELVLTNLAGLGVVKSDLHQDHRGRFSRLFCDRELAPILGDKKIVQINYSSTAKQSTVRGMHFQHAPAKEVKIVRCMKGEIFDVAVDLRKNSPTFLQWHAEVLSEENAKAMVIPEGFAHGFQTLKDNVEMLYLHTEHYHSECEGGVRCDDPALAIEWPLAISELSERDRAFPLIDDCFEGIE